MGDQRCPVAADGMLDHACCRRCDIMIHTANEFTAQHHRYLVSGTQLGLHSMAGGGEGGAAAAAAEGEKGSSRRSAGVSSPSASKASTGFGLGGSRCVLGRRLAAGHRCGQILHAFSLHL